MEMKKKKRKRGQYFAFRLKRWLPAIIILGATGSFHYTDVNDGPLMFIPNVITTEVGGDDKMAVVALISNLTSDIEGIANAIQQLNPTDVPVLIFHQGDVTIAQQDYIRAKIGTTTSKITFPIQADFDKFPPNFNPSVEAPMFVKRSKWGYQHMCRFWISLVWHHLALQAFDTILRIDADSCFSSPHSNDTNTLMLSLPPDTVYKANPPIVNDAWPNHGLLDSVQDYVRVHDIQPKNPKLLHLAQQTLDKEHRLPMFRNNLELDRLSFFQSTPVQDFQRYLVSNFEFYRYRWGDAPIRFLTLAIFATSEQLEMSLELIPGYQHGAPACGTKEIRVWKKIRANNN